MYGWRARVGLLLPSTDTTTEPEFYKLAPLGVTFHSSRMIIQAITLEGLAEMEEQSVRAAKEVATAGVNLIGFCCTSGGFIKGPLFEKEVQEKIEKVSGVPALTTSQAVIEGLKTLQIRKVAVATPYNEEINQKEKEFLEANGIEVTEIIGLNITRLERHFPLTRREVSPIGLLEPYVAYRLAQEVNSQKAQGVFISCTGFRTIEIIDLLERDLKKPVISSNQAMFAAMMKRLGITEKIEGYGRLLRG